MDSGYQKKAVLLLSGGLDSSTLLAKLKSENYQIYALSFHYGQRHSNEIKIVQELTHRFPVQEHKIAEIDLRLFGKSALTDSLVVPKSTELHPRKIPVTYVPARNTIFLSFALGYAEIVGADEIFMGANLLDYHHYPDCRPEYLAAFEKLANLATQASTENGKAFQIHAPFLQMTKAEIIQMGLNLRFDYSLTRSCYDPSEEGLSCGMCGACHLRLEGFAQVGIEDPAPYAPKTKRK